MIASIVSTSSATPTLCQHDIYDGTNYNDVLLFNTDTIVGDFIYERVKVLQQKLNINAVAIRSHLTNGRLGIVYLTVIPETYNTLSKVELRLLQNQGYIIQYSDNTSQYQIQVINKAYDMVTKLIEPYGAYDLILKISL